MGQVNLIRNFAWWKQLCDVKQSKRESTRCHKNSLSVSRWGSLSCRWWQGWRSKPRCTREHFHSGWSCWWTGCRCCLCSRHSYSCPYPSHRCQKPTQRLSPNHGDPGEHTVHSDKQGKKNYHRPFCSFMLQTTTVQKIPFILNGNPNYRRANSFQGSFQKEPIKTRHTSQRPGWSSVN